MITSDVGDFDDANGHSLSDFTSTSRNNGTTYSIGYLLDLYTCNIYLL